MAVVIVVAPDFVVAGCGCGCATAAVLLVVTYFW